MARLLYKLFKSSTEYFIKDSASTTDFDNLLTDLYPVGTVVFTTTNTKPTIPPGSTWAALTTGYIKVSGAYSATAAGSNYTSAVSITAAMMPSHTHSITTNNTGAHTHSLISAGGHTHSLISAGAHTHTANE